jgi:hypothetical protein
MKFIKRKLDAFFARGRNKDIFILASVILVLVIAVCGDGFADIAKRKFWFNFWAVAQVIAIVGSVGGWIYLWTTQDKTKK